MKAIITALFVMAFSFVAIGAALRDGEQSQRVTDAKQRRPVIVELFTSEGCSSCPPADALLAALEERQPVAAAEVIALEEHVDYWDDQGWKDPFSSRDWTARQYVYSESLPNRNPYTPQMVVNGKVEFTGSQSRKAVQAIHEAAQEEKTPVNMTVGNSEKAGTEVVTVRIGKLAGNSKSDTAEVWVAITETGLHSAVKGGENAGEELHHAAVVRTMRKIGEAKGEGETSFSGDANIRLQSEWKRENLKVVAFVQEKKNRRILGAAEMRVAR